MDPVVGKHIFHECIRKYLKVFIYLFLVSHNSAMLIIIYNIYIINHLG